jgi:hypothetical protein
MLDKQNTDIREKILEGLKLSSKRLIQNKKDRNLDIVVSENGKIVRLTPNQL